MDPFSSSTTEEVCICCAVVSDTDRLEPTEDAIRKCGTSFSFNSGRSISSMLEDVKKELALSEGFLLSYLSSEHGMFFSFEEKHLRYEPSAPRTLYVRAKKRSSPSDDDVRVKRQKLDICSRNTVTEKTSNVNEVVSITLRDLEKANSTLEDFCRSYFMFHDMNGESVHDVFKHFPILAFVEGYIYQIDEKKESQLLPSNCALSQQRHVGFASEASLKAEEKCFESLRAILTSRKLWTSRIEKELKSGLEYWNLERSLCRSLLLEEEISLPDVMQAVKLKSFDYRVLNLLLHEMSNQPVNETHMEFLSASEVLVEISDDLFDYEEDVLHNSFNILRMFVRIYGPSKAPYMLAQVIAEAEEKYKELLGQLKPHLALEYQKRCQQAVVEGGGTCSQSHPMGSWTIPSLILNEHMYREQHWGGT